MWEEEGHVAALARLAEEAVGQDPVHRRAHVPPPEPVSGGGKAPGEPRRRLRRVPPFAGEPAAKARIDPTHSRAHVPQPTGSRAQRAPRFDKGRFNVAASVR